MNMTGYFKSVGMTVLAVAIANGPACAQTAPQSSESVCTVAAPMRPMATEVRETSGLARGRTNADVFWTHNDSGNEPQLFAIATDGTIKTRVALPNLRVTDWEDIEAGTCGDAHCLYLADIGDNAAKRKNISIYEVREPAMADRAAEIRRTFNAVYPDGAQDAEALFRLPDGTLYVVTKGRHKAIKLYRFSAAGANDQGSLQLVREIAAQPRAEADRVTSATASPNGNWVAIRSYSTLYLFRTADLLNGGAPAVTHSLVSLAEKQGESITLDDDGTIWMTSEAEREADAPTIVSLRCTLPT
jgi:hypothetical protein